MDALFHAWMLELAAPQYVRVCVCVCMQVCNVCHVCNVCMYIMYVCSVRLHVMCVFVCRARMCVCIHACNVMYVMHIGAHACMHVVMHCYVCMCSVVCMFYMS